MANLDRPGRPHQTVGGFDRSGRLWVAALCGGGGVALGALIPILARWVATLPWAPLQGPIELLGSTSQPWLAWGRPVLGLAVGLAMAAWIVVDSPVLDIHDHEIHVRRRGQVERVIERAKVDAVYRRGSKLVIETDTGRPLFEGEIEGDEAAVRDVFVTHGFPWEGPRD